MKPIEEVVVDGIKAYVYGDLSGYYNYEEVKKHFHIQSWYGDYGKVDFYVKADPQIVVGNKVFYTNSITISGRNSIRSSGCVMTC